MAVPFVAFLRFAKSGEALGEWACPRSLPHIQPRRHRRLEGPLGVTVGIVWGLMEAASEASPKAPGPAGNVGPRRKRPGPPEAAPETTRLAWSSARVRRKLRPARPKQKGGVAGHRLRWCGHRVHRLAQSQVDSATRLFERCSVTLDTRVTFDSRDRSRPKPPKARRDDSRAGNRGGHMLAAGSKPRPRYRGGRRQEGA